MTRVHIVHHRWGYGGGEAVFYYTIKALHDAGYDVTISTVDPPDLRSYSDIVGEPLPSSIKFASTLNVNVKMLTLYKALVSGKHINRGSFDVIVATHGYPFILSNEIKAPIIYYMHFPAVLIPDKFWNPGVSRYELRSPTSYGFTGFAKSIPLWLYFQPYKLLSRRFYKKLIKTVSKVLVNSTYTLEAFKYSLLKHTDLNLEAVGELLSRTLIVHPPLPRAWELLKLRGGRRLPCVATIGRFSSEKRYDLALDVARMLPKHTFILAGGVYGRASKAYYEWIRSKAPNNVIVKANVPAYVKNIILSKCTAYLHTMTGEHFGIAPLEALASGMTPVVPKRSGTWTDICNNGKYCYGYTKQEPKEIAEPIRRALEKPLTAPIEHVEKFAPEKFMEKILRVVDETLKEGRIR